MCQGARVCGYETGTVGFYLGEKNRIWGPQERAGRGAQGPRGKAQVRNRRKRGDVREERGVQSRAAIARGERQEEGSNRSINCCCEKEGQGVRTRGVVRMGSFLGMMGVEAS